MVSGPPARLKFTQPGLENQGWGAERILLWLENRLKCGPGIRGRCNFVPYYACKDGPVFSKAALDRLAKEY